MEKNQFEEAGELLKKIEEQREKLDRVETLIECEFPVYYIGEKGSGRMWHTVILEEDARPILEKHQAKIKHELDLLELKFKKL